MKTKYYLMISLSVWYLCFPRLACADTTLNCKYSGDCKVLDFNEAQFGADYNKPLFVINTAESEDIITEQKIIKFYKDQYYSKGIRRAIYVSYKIQEEPTQEYNVKFGKMAKLGLPLFVTLNMQFSEGQPFQGILKAEYTKTLAPHFWLKFNGTYTPQIVQDSNGMSSAAFGSSLGWKTTAIQFAWVPKLGSSDTYHINLSVNLP